MSEQKQKQDLVQIRRIFQHHEGYLVNAVSEFARELRSFESIKFADRGNLGLCPRLNAMRLMQIFEGGFRPSDFDETWKLHGLDLWMILFVLDCSHPIMREAQELFRESLKVYRQYCAEKLAAERPAALLNNSGRQDIYPVVAILSNGDRGGHEIVEFCKDRGFDTFPLILVMDRSTPVRQHVGEVTVDALRELLDRTPASGQRVY